MLHTSTSHLVTYNTSAYSIFITPSSLVVITVPLICLHTVAFPFRSVHPSTSRRGTNPTVPRVTWFVVMTTRNKQIRQRCRRMHTAWPDGSMLNWDDAHRLRGIIHVHSPILFVVISSSGTGGIQLFCTKNHRPPWNCVLCSSKAAYCW